MNDLFVALFVLMIVALGIAWDCRKPMRSEVCEWLAVYPRPFWQSFTFYGFGWLYIGRRINDLPMLCVRLHLPRPLLRSRFLVKERNR
jgi:hypothetical protein